MLSAGQDSVTDVVIPPLVSDGTALVEDFFDGDVAGKDNHRRCPKDQAEHLTILLRPFLKLLVHVSLWHLKK